MDNRKRNEINLIHAFKSHDLSLDDFDCVIITKKHKDLTGNLTLFPNVEVIISNVTIYRAESL